MQLFYCNGVVWVTNMKPDYKNYLSYFYNVVNLICLFKNLTENNYNMKKLSGGIMSLIIQIYISCFK